MNVPGKNRARLTEGEVEGLGGEVTNDVGGVTTPEREKTLVGVGTTEAVHNTLVWCGETTLLDLERKGLSYTRLHTAHGSHHLILVLNQQLDTLDGGSGCLRNSL